MDMSVLRIPMIVRLRGVALFRQINSMRTSRVETVETATPSDCRSRLWPAPERTS